MELHTEAWHLSLVRRHHEFVVRPGRDLELRGQAVADPPIVELRRTVATCLLWEPTFYEAGDAIAERIRVLAHQVKPEQLAEQIARAWPAARGNARRSR